MNWTNCLVLHSVVMILCCLYAECQEVTANLGDTRNFSAVFGESATITCVLNSGTIVQADQRQWFENSKLIINDGTLVNTNSGYSESVGSNSFTLTTPTVNYSFVGYKYTCRYVFDEADFYLTAVEEPSSTEDCRDPFLYGFLPVFLIVLVSSIICLIILKLELPVFEKMGGLSMEKIVIIIVFNVVAIAVGLGLGFGLRSGDDKCENWKLGLGLSITLGVVIPVILYIVIICFNSKKGSEDEGVTSDKKTDTERSDGDKRARSPVSASAVKVQAEKSSHNKPTEKSTGASSLQTKSYGSPLPEIPTRKQDSGEMESSHEKTHIKSHGSRNNQLEPLNADNVEGESSVPEKKKKKKKKKKREDSRENEEEN